MQPIARAAFKAKPRRAHLQSRLEGPAPSFIFPTRGHGALLQTDSLLLLSIPMASSLQLDLSSEEVLALVEAGVISGQTIHDAYRAEAASAGWPRSDLPEIDVLESLVAKGVLTNEGVLDWMQSGVVTAQTGPAGGRSSKPRRRPTDPKDKAPWYMRGLNAPIFVKTDLQPELALLSRQGNCVAHGIGHVIGKALDAVAYAKIFPAAASRGRKYVDVAAALGVGLQEAPGRACVVGASESGQARSIGSRGTASRGPPSGRAK